MIRYNIELKINREESLTDDGWIYKDVPSIEYVAHPEGQWISYYKHLELLEEAKINAFHKGLCK